MIQLGRPQIIFDMVLAFSYLIIVVLAYGQLSIHLLSAVVLAVALVIRRRNPALTLGLAWLAAMMQMVFGTIPAFLEVGILLALYASTAYGGIRTRKLSGLSVIVGTLLATAYTVGPTIGVPVWDIDNYQNSPLNMAEFRQLIPLIVIFFLGLGIVLGSLYGWAGAQSLLGSSLQWITVELSWALIAIMVVAAALLIWISSAVPSRRALKLAPVQALAMD